MTNDEALRFIRRKANAVPPMVYLPRGQHADKRTVQRGGIRQGDYREALKSAHTCVAGDKPRRWQVTGKDLQGDDLTVVVVIPDDLDDDLVVVTVF